jgi:RNA polymerase sigma-70 factor, ECF subfamily
MALYLTIFMVRGDALQKRPRSAEAGRGTRAIPTICPRAVSIARVTDDDLVARAREGDSAAFGDLVLRHQAAVHRAALAATGSASDADDVAQEAFLLAYRRLGSFRGAASFKTWLLTIAWNQAINRRRANTRWWGRVVNIADEDFGAAGSASGLSQATATPEQLAGSGELRRAIRQAIVALPRKLRDALLLAQSGDYSYDEIGAMLGAPVGTIKWRVSEARRAVRASLRARGHEYE